MKGQTRQNRKPNATPKKVQKLTPQEFQKLQNISLGRSNTTNQIKSICYKKELEIRAIEADFNKRYDHLSFSLESLDEAYKAIVLEFQKKYGNQVSFDLQTGEIKPLNLPNIEDENIDDDEATKPLEDNKKPEMPDTNLKKTE